MDDATGSVVNALFCEQENARSYFPLVQGLVQSCGKPLALYIYRRPVFKYVSEYQPAGTPTQFGRAIADWGFK